MGCCDGFKPSTSEEQRYGVNINTPCGAISVDMLKMFKRPIDCYLKYSLWSKIGSSENELTNAGSTLEQLIEQKEVDMDDCSGIESLQIIRVLVDRIIKAGVCL